MSSASTRSGTGSETLKGARQVRRVIHRLLDAADIDWEETAHEVTRTAEEAAAARGFPLEIGAKSIVLKTDDDFRLFVLSGAARLRSRFIRRHLGVHRTRFATNEELDRLTGLEPGAIPPFGEPVLPLELYVDSGLLLNDRLAFTPGVRDASILLDTADYLSVARPQIFSFAAAASPPSAGCDD